MPNLPMDSNGGLPQRLRHVLEGSRWQQEADGCIGSAQMQPVQTWGNAYGKEPVSAAHGVQRTGDSESEMSESIIFTIPGTPVGKGRPKFARRGKFVTTYTPEKTASYENLVKLYASQAMCGHQPYQGAVSASIGLWLVPPASWSKKKRAQALAHEIHPTSKPDIDNVVKGIFDAMNDIVFVDDKQVVRLHVEKFYSEIARAEVKITQFGVAA
jgi:Holliday junction resolvase RusA-like endonuclease